MKDSLESTSTEFWQKLVIFGSGGLAREVAQVVRDINREHIHPIWVLIGYLDDCKERYGLDIQGRSVLGGVEWLRYHEDVKVVVGVGSPTSKVSIVKEILDKSPNTKFATLVHPLAWAGDNVRIGHGTVLCAGVYATTDVWIGSHVLLNLTTTVGHDTKISDYCTVNPGTNISGNIHVGHGAFLGTGCTAIEGVHIGAGSIVGAGAVVIRDVQPSSTVVGIPAKPITNP